MKIRRSAQFVAAFAALSVLAAPPAALAQRRAPAALRPVQPAEAGFDAARLAKLDAAMKAAVDEGRTAGMVTVLGRGGRIVDTNVYGRKSIAANTPMTEDTIFRIYSMTKPVTGVAMMILFEEGRWKLDDPVTKYVPEFSKLRVIKSVGANGVAVLEDMKRPPTMRELMTHTASFGYGLSGDDPANKAFREQGVLRSQGLQQMIDKISGIPLLNQPGEAWRYSAAVDIQGYIVEKLSGQPLDVFMAERIFRPLRMVDTGFQVPADKVNRFAAVYAVNPQSGALIEASSGPLVQDFTKPPTLVSGGGGLVSTAADYARFCQMVLNGGELDGARILAPATVALMSANHLPEGVGLNSDGRNAGGLFAPGMGFGLGFSRIQDQAKAGTLAGEGTLAWGGAAGTWFWIDPKNDLFFIGMIQRFGGSNSLGVADQSRALVYQALTGPVR
jgi:CubicO group peptidase (beta-lactamase class C family)